MAKQPPPEKRSARRTAADFVVEIYDIDGVTLIGVGRLLNLSAFGACIESTSILAEGTKFIVRLLLGRRHLLTLPVETVWLRLRPNNREYGLRFGELPAMVKSLIRRYVDEYFDRPEDGKDFLDFPPTDAA